VERRWRALQLEANEGTAFTALALLHQPPGGGRRTGAPARAPRGRTGVWRQWWGGGLWAAPCAVGTPADGRARAPRAAVLEAGRCRYLRGSLLSPASAAHARGHTGASPGKVRRTMALRPPPFPPPPTSLLLPTRTPTHLPPPPALLPSSLASLSRRPPGVPSMTRSDSRSTVCPVSCPLPCPSLHSTPTSAVPRVYNPPTYVSLVLCLPWWGCAVPPGSPRPGLLDQGLPQSTLWRR